MGYQESYVRMKNSSDFELLVKVIQQNKKKSFLLAEPVKIITLLKPISGNLGMQCKPEIDYSFEANEKFIYVTGERSGQRNAHSFFEACQNIPCSILNNLEIYFTECFPSQEIFEKNTKMAIHETFIWDA